MKCEYCNKEFSYTVLAIHKQRCAYRPSETPSFDEMTKAELMAYANSKEITYNPRDKKADLVKAIMGE